MVLSTTVTSHKIYIYMTLNGEDPVEPLLGILVSKEKSSRCSFLHVPFPLCNVAMSHIVFLDDEVSQLVSEV